MVLTPEEVVVGLFERTAATVPAYRTFLAEHGIDPATIGSAADFSKLPLVDKPGYLRRYPLPELCRDGRIADMIAMSSGSTGEPTPWPRSMGDEQRTTARFEQVFRDGFQAAERRTLAVVCFALGTWVGGLYTLGCVRELAARGYPVTTVAPGNNKAEILRVLPTLAPHFDQVVLLGYPPFLKDVIDSGHAEGVPWVDYRIKLVTAGEVFSEEWRTLVAQRAHCDPRTDIASLYGTADAGVLANETPLSVEIRRLLAARPEIARELFGESRLPTLVQYDPYHRFFEAVDGTLVVSADGGIPLVRYHIADEGGLIPHHRMLDFLHAHGLHPRTEGPEQPFVYVFGRSHFTVSFYGANIYPENITVGLERPGVAEHITGKFVLEVVSDGDEDRHLQISVELAPGTVAFTGLATRVADSVHAELLRLNSEFAHYVPARRQRPRVLLHPHGDPEYFPPGVKHRYTRAPR
ncbi:phenylacetate--CoA ligase family protein [Nocardia sp. 2]|uniref:Phenylacetate--CoA ligase family protein n=1 Tax=Nocardia acididurans TaxID=2802282 RepID=A0ABS1M7X4_9NOCA|nr:phenylacetate--CoA ligase family protein [Nocardia acididurans]MBL1076737.1 phenylacetate--CoA ligase family protein [Nocardia acididurans]